MKSTILWVLRYLLIPVGFIWTTGIFTQFHKFNFGESEKYSIHTFDSSEIATLEMNPNNAIAYGDSLVQERTRLIQKTGVYDPYLYFRDLKQYEMFEKVYLDSLNKTGNGRCVIISCISGMGMSSKGQLVNLRDENWRKIDVDGLAAQNHTQHSGYMRKIMSIEEARRYWFPSDVARELLVPPVRFWSDIFMPIITWLKNIYMRGLPVAFLLFLIWRIKFKKEVEETYWQYIDRKKPEFNFGFAPLSFIVSLLFWPIILWIDIRNRLNETLRKVEVLSRRKNMFSLLSRSDKKLVEIGKKMSLKEFREHLENIGMVRKHSFALALVVILCLVITPRMIIPAASFGTIIHITNIDNGGIDHDVGNSFHIDVSYYEAVIVPLVRIVNSSTIYIIYFTNQVWKTMKGFLLDIDGVPKVIINLI
ncbi:MAG: hypothetical protein WAV23_03455 [Minisyncoccia bacterium]